MDMQITERNYPALSKLKSGRLGKCDVHTSDMDEVKSTISDGYTMADFMSINFKNNCELYSKNIFYVCKSLDDAVRKSTDAIDKLSTDEFISIFWSKDHHGTIIFDGFVYCYEFNSDMTQSLFVFDNNQLIVCVARGVVFKSKTFLNDIKDFFDNIFYVLFFIDHAKIETVTIKHGCKTVFNKEKWVNNSNNNLTIIDSLWFTTLVSSGAFSVRGHFRLQPYKDRKELIWIKDFEKHGYTRYAKKLGFSPDESFILPSPTV